ncbi:MAG: hypothetical protein E6R03_10735, partial [Hyphomicrobiaceae bacterium]
MSDGITIETVDLDVLASIQLLVPGEQCPHCHGSGKSVHYSKSHGDQVWDCHYCYGGLVAYPICACGDWQHQHESMTGKCLVCEHDREGKFLAMGHGPCSRFRFAWNEKPVPGTGKIVAAEFWEMWNKYGHTIVQ